MEFTGEHDMFIAEKENRPWGSMIKFLENKQGTTKVLMVNKGEALSLQYHEKRDQLYFMLDDNFMITIGDDGKAKDKDSKVRLVEAKKGDMFVFNKQTIHRAEYKGDKPFGMYLEVAVGEYNEKDIVRLADRYGRDEE
jgi:mannose-6-phosphate isomerase-like protein (cupin superfamily)